MTNRRHWSLLCLGAVLLLALAGCGRRKVSFQAEPAGAAPLAQAERSVKREGWVYEPFKLERDTEVQVSVALTGGPPVDLYVMTAAGFDRWNVLVGRGQPTVELDFEAVPMLGLEGLSSAFTSEWTPLVAGTYYVVVDNTSYGGTAPPVTESDGVATVDVKVDARSPLK